MYEFTLILAFTIIYLVIVNKAFKKKTDWMSIGLLQLAVPWAIHLVAAIVFPNTQDPTWYPLAGVSVLATLLLFFIFNYTEMWFRQHYKFDEERVVILNTFNNEPDSDTVNTYKPKFRESDQLEQLFQHNWDIITRLRGVEPFRDMVQHYYTLHPEKVSAIAAAKEAEEQEQSQNPSETPLKSKSKRKTKSTNAAKPEEEQPTSEPSLEKTKTESLLVFKEIFKGIHFHVRYMRWFFFLDVDSEVDLHDRLKIYILSPRANLPTVLNLNCGFLIDERENGKKFTVMIALEGYRIQAAIDRIINLSSDLECFKFFPKFSELDKLQKRAEYWEQMAYSLLDELENLSKHNLTIRQKIEDLTPKIKRKSIFSRVKGDGE